MDVGSGWPTNSQKNADTSATAQSLQISKRLATKEVDAVVPEGLTDLSYVHVSASTIGFYVVVNTKRSSRAEPALTKTT